jgi:S-adenosylmethionine-diacylgycerolhomoserine-N-methlytransferase
LIAVVDFHATPLLWFRRWMGCNHVRMEAHLLPALRVRFESRYEAVSRAWGGWWSYFLFLGTPRVR